MDEYWNTFAYASPGVAKLLNTDFTVTIPFTPPIPVPVPLRPVVYLIIAILDSIRLSKAIAGTQTNLLTLLVFIEELLTGQWRQMILTAAGFISPSGVALGVIFKYIVNAWMLVNPALRDTILKDMYKGSKSLFIGFLLWIGSTLPPNVVKAPLQASFDQIQNLVSGLEDKVKEIEEQASTTLAPVGKKLKFKDLKLNTLSRISLQDIQNLQTLAQWKVITCSAEFDDIMKPLTQIPIFRFIIELLGIPTIPTDKFEACGAPPYKSIAEVASEAFTPEIIDTLPTLALPQLPTVPTLPVPQVPTVPNLATPTPPTESVESKSTNVDSTPKKQSGGQRSENSKRRKSKSKSKASKPKSKRLTLRRSSRTR
jgi:hypothetical protein